MQSVNSKHIYKLEKAGETEEAGGAEKNIGVDFKSIRLRILIAC